MGLGCVGSFVYLNRNTRKIIQIPNLKQLTRSTLHGGSFLLEENMSWQKWKNEPFYIWTHKYNGKHKIERSLKSSEQTAMTRSYYCFTSLRKFSELLIWKVENVRCRMSNGPAILNCHSWCDNRNHHRAESSFYSVGKVDYCNGKWYFLKKKKTLVMGQYRPHTSQPHKHNFCDLWKIEWK